MNPERSDGSRIPRTITGAPAGAGNIAIERPTTYCRKAYKVGGIAPRVLWAHYYRGRGSG
jgi:hypothetical protein